MVTMLGTSHRIIHETKNIDGMKICGDTPKITFTNLIQAKLLFWADVRVKELLSSKFQIWDVF